MSDRSITLPSFAKINWTLEVRGRRTDGYHELCTVFQTVDLHDTVVFSEAEELTLECSDPTIPVGEENLILRAARLLERGGGVRRGARIFLEKRIPASGGLGGGSSNAAVALLGLATLWGLGPSAAELASMAEVLGSDVPFFLVGGTAAAAGRGEELAPMQDISEPFLVLLNPGVRVGTAEAFKGLNMQNLTDIRPESTLAFCLKGAGSLQIEQGQLVNDFEASVFEREPGIREARDFLSAKGARVAQMSGSGSTIFAVFDKEETRQATLKATLRENWRMFAAATLSRTEYREALDPCHRLLPISF